MLLLKLGDDRIWDSVLERFKLPLSNDLYQQFMNLLQIYVCWKVIDKELDFEGNLSKEFGFTCPNTTKDIILVIFFD